MEAAAWRAAPIPPEDQLTAAQGACHAVLLGAVVGLNGCFAQTEEAWEDPGLALGVRAGVYFQLFGGTVAAAVADRLDMDAHFDDLDVATCGYIQKQAVAGSSNWESA